jgi:hypothetical protein
MANPVIVSLNEWEWVKVATSVTTGTISKIKTKVDYYQTYRETGDTAPTALTRKELPEEAIEMFKKSDQEPIADESLIDVYVMCKNDDGVYTDTGKIRVDL